MAVKYSVEVCRTLQERVISAQLHRPIQVSRYDAGTRLVYTVRGVEKGNRARIELIVEDFVGGGFAGQVYKVKVLQIDWANEPIEGIVAGGIYAMKILVPPSKFSHLFRNMLYRFGFQGPFQLQVNPVAVRADLLWQKFIRRGARIRFGNERSVCDIFATFVDERLCSCGQLNEWVQGRTWQLEADQYMDVLRKWCKGQSVDENKLGSGEFRTKRTFMSEFVRLMHDMGAYEFARQYEWSTAKSQPNCLKRLAFDSNPDNGLVAVDFSPGLVLLPFLPMSPGDFKLIAKGIARGSLVQFDRGDVRKLGQFIDKHPDQFEDMKGMLSELRSTEQVYRESIVDVTHNHIRLLYSRRLWSTITERAIAGWKVRNLADKRSEEIFQSSRFKAMVFLLIGILPVLGKFLRRIWGRADWRKHYVQLLTNQDYFKRALQAKMAEKAIVWHRAGRINESAAINAAQSLPRFVLHFILSIIPFARLHRFLTDRQYVREVLIFLFFRPVRLYFNAQMREKWLREMVVEGREKHMLTDDDTNTILSRIAEPFIQQYLKSLAVHICTLPVTQVVSVIVATIYVLQHPELNWEQAVTRAGGILVAFQIIPISPGSLVRGLYVLFLVLRQHNFKDYNIAIFLGFFKYIGYLAFPIQMTYRYPALARFMACHWATEATHIIPVFGERGALLEHWVFRLFYNWPLTIRRRMVSRAVVRRTQQPRYWHVLLYALGGAVLFGVVDLTFMYYLWTLPVFTDIWWLWIIIPMVCGAVVTMGCGGAALGKRIVAAVICGISIGLFYTMASAILINTEMTAAGGTLTGMLFWRMLCFGVFSAMGALVTELTLPEVQIKS
ncbi:MAG: hypothetical protein JXB29_00770 [Sedimentisphaerales bacterium]|nr:hypothetical protein [Sedimentisphaerales bacterium]